MSGCVSQRAVQGNDVALLEQFVQGNVPDTAVFGGKKVIGNDVHAKPPANVNENPADFSCADDTDGLAVKVESGQAVERKVELPGAIERFVDAAH